MAKKSVFQDEKVCLICGKTPVEEHHIFGGFNRKHSDADGLVVYLCHNHHNEPPDGVHFNPKFMLALHKKGQLKYLENHTMDEWMRRYGRNYLEADEIYIDS